MKKIIFFICFCALIASCTSSPEKMEKNELLSENVSNPSETSFTITESVFDTLQNPLGFVLSSQCKPITRLNWEYHMTGIGWWDIYLLSGRKLGNGLYEKSISIKTDCQIVELHGTRSQYDYSVLGVELIFVASEKAVVERLQSQFNSVATDFTGKQFTSDSRGSKTWEFGWICYTSYPIQYYEGGKWIYIISSFDLAHSPY